MQISEIYQLLRKFAIAATNYADTKVVIAHQISHVRPKKPFITVDLANLRKIGTFTIKGFDAGKDVEIFTLPMVADVAFQCYSDQNHEAEEVLNTLYAYFSTELQNDIFQGNIALRRTIRKTTAIPQAINQQIESRAILEIEIGFNKDIEIESSYIEQVMLNMNINEHNKTLTLEK